jgi:DNA-binding CsgD family transcriptional regulator
VIPPATVVVGRDEELAALADFVGGQLPAALLIEGAPGIGKTTLWLAGLALAGERFRVLRSSPSRAETQLSYAGVADLLDGVLGEALVCVPEPQQRALRVALLLEDAAGRPAEPGAIAIAFLNVLRALAERSPLLVAIDDVQWLDPASGSVLAYAARRLRTEPVALLVARRVEGPEPLPLDFDRLPPEQPLARIALGPLTLGALHHLLRGRLGTSFPRPTLRRLHEVSGGNPFYALELGRALERQGGRLEPGAELPLPGDLSALLRARLAPLRGETREALLAAAALAAPTLALLEAALSGDLRAALQPAVEADVIDITDERVRFTHPLLASAVYAEAEGRRRRECHGRLAEVVADTEERARHLALAVEAPDTAVAAALDEAAQAAFARGAVDSAASLGEQALRVTPDEQSAALQSRRLAAAGYLARAGSKARARALVDAAHAAAPRGPERAQIALGLAWWGLGDNQTRIAALREAVEDAREDPRLLAQVHAVLGAVLFPEIDVAAANRHATVALELAERVGDPATLAVALTLAEHIDFFAGRGVDDERVERALALEAVGANPWGDIGVARWLRGHQLLATGELDAARRSFEALAAEGRSRGDASLANFLRFLADVEILAGNWQQAQELADEAVEITREVDDVAQEAKCHHPLTLLAALRGDAAAAWALGANGLRLAERIGHMLARARIAAALGLLELSLGNAAAARSHLEHTAGLVARMRLGEPGLVPFVPDLVEAFVTLGELEAAEAATAELEEQGRRLGRRLALAGAARCRGLIAAARGDLAGAVETLEDGRDQAALVGQPFELARTLLALGTVQRRAQQKRAARETLTQALAIFDELGARLWSERARSELARIGGRAARTSELTETERQIAGLVAAGRSNHEVAVALHLSPKTVEWNLSKMYRKLGVRSRTALAAHLSRERLPGAR